MDSSDELTTIELKQKMHFKGVVQAAKLAGALIEIGVGKPAFLHISEIKSEDDTPVKSVEEFLKPGQEIDVWVKKIKDDRIELSMHKPLDYDWRDLKKEMVVKGKVVRIEKFGVFVEIGAERPGLIHISELSHSYVRTPEEVVKEGDEVEAQILDVNRRKKQIKLSIKAIEPEPVVEEAKKPFPKEGEKKDRGPQQHRHRKPGKRGGEDSFDESGRSMIETMSTPIEEDPTAMEIAMRDAMEKSKVRERRLERESHHRAKRNSYDQEDLMLRTLEQKK